MARQILRNSLTQVRELAKGGAPSEDNHFYLKIHAGEFKFKHTCARAQNHKNFINFKH